MGSAELLSVPGRGNFHESGGVGDKNFRGQGRAFHYVFHEGVPFLEAKVEIKPA
jgi:hypothetical protein